MTARLILLAVSLALLIAVSTNNRMSAAIVNLEERDNAQAAPLHMAVNYNPEP